MKEGSTIFESQHRTLKYSGFLKIKFTTEYLNFFMLKEAISNQEQKIGQNAASRKSRRALRKLKKPEDP